MHPADLSTPSSISPIPPFKVTGRLDGAVPLLLTAPHSGQWLPEDFLQSSMVPSGALRLLEDAHTAALLRETTRLGVPLIEATHARAVIDLNRAPNEYDPAMLSGRLNERPISSDRVRRGYGLFPKHARPGQPIHRQQIAADLAQQRLDTLHHPWHNAVAAALAAARARHQVAVLLDVHSMPPLTGPTPARLVLGDRHGTSAASTLVRWLQTAFEAEGLRVARNNPYAGGHNTERHGLPGVGIHAVQLEFDRSLYMDLASLEPHEGFAALSAMLARVVLALSEWLTDGQLDGQLPAAAE